MSEDHRGQARAHGGADPALGHRAARFLAPILTLFFVAVGGGAALAAPVCDLQAVFLRTPAGSEIRFATEVADDTAERALGLMRRPSMPASASMLFVYPAPVRARFWMKDTLIPLDMIFADESGVVRRVHSMARPLDETVIDGGEAVKFVVEINGGLAKRMGIAEGSLLMHPAVDQALAKWPCPQG